MQTADFLVIGGGIVGLTTALEAARRHPTARVVLLEKEPRPGQHASGRNSGVLHAGLYYRPGSLKARMAAEGNRRLTAYCEERNLAIRRCGKLVLARDEAEEAALDQLCARARTAGVQVELLTAADAARLEPAARVRDRALFSPSTATVDPGQVVAALATDARGAGVDLRSGERFHDWDGVVVVTNRGRWSAGYVVNAAGAQADRVARRFGFGDGYRIVPFKGRYLRCSAPSPIRMHLYPVPDLRYPFLGVHLTVAVDGTLMIGPTAAPALGREQYRARDVRPGDAVSIGLAVARLFTAPAGAGLRRLAVDEIFRHCRQALVAAGEDLARGLPGPAAWTPGRPGIRAQLVDTRRWNLVDDFVYQADDHSCHVLNAVSPGFTCALPLAEHLLDIIENEGRGSGTG